MELVKSVVHEHERVLNKQDDNKQVRCCKGCAQPISGGPDHYYYCRHQLDCDFFLHKSCGELPLQIAHHLLHKSCDGLLQFDPMPPSLSRFNSKCDSCGQDLQSCKYICLKCRFCIDFPCALASLLPPSIAFGDHQHLFTLWAKPALFSNCNACGTTHHDKVGFSYLCTECQLCVHQDCASSLPNTIKHNAHIHLLTLTWYFPPDYRITSPPLCEICSGDIRYEPLLYNCFEGCKFSVHFNCAKSKTLQATHLPVQDISIHLVSQIFKKKISLEGENQTSAMEEEMKHFSHHDHPLKLSDHREQAVISSNEDLRCQACMQTISDYHPFYSCTECKYFMHKSCSELPTEIMKHPFHPQHVLVLVYKVPTFCNMFECNACRNRCNGFTFRCASCDFDLDLTCSSISGTIIHESHEHPLVCRWYDHYTIICDACNLPSKEGLVFGCVACGFNLHINCALLPRTVRHRRDEHPLTISYCLSINKSEEYICDTCEEDVDTKLWFYYCAECDNPLHPGCISSFNDDSNILFGSKVDIKGHPHPLTLTRKTRDKPPCHKCGKPYTMASA